MRGEDRDLAPVIDQGVGDLLGGEYQTAWRMTIRAFFRIRMVCSNVERLRSGISMGDSLAK